jgi:hypothetical protein
MANALFNHLPFKNIEEWESAQKEEPDESLKAIQKSLSKEMRRRSAAKKEKENLEKLAKKHGFRLEPEKPEPTKAVEALKEIVKPGEAKAEEKKPAAGGAKPFI